MSGKAADLAPRSAAAQRVDAAPELITRPRQARVPRCGLETPRHRRDGADRALARERFVPITPFAKPPGPGMLGGPAIMKLPEIERTISGVAMIMPPARNIIMKNDTSAPMLLAPEGSPSSVMSERDMPTSVENTPAITSG